ncbi:hypothetical protein E2C01_006570 [Portunus trituberculatus]|uniref:Uncharacterized protein n=1 Tax=Portunus trituberculatus TaxID=210409 RepID=A0A5B7CVK0_PORTR|nr:hypothetical protein [Portunus trituberculatus]
MLLLRARQIEANKSSVMIIIIPTTNPIVGGVPSPARVSHHQPERRDIDVPDGGRDRFNFCNQSLREERFFYEYISERDIRSSKRICLGMCTPGDGDGTPQPRNATIAR